MNVLIIDNYDSFVYNLAQYVGELGSKPMVYRNDQLTLNRIKRLKPDRIIISPGPGTPEHKKYFGICLDILHKLSPNVPTLGVCLGNQGIGYAFGARIKPASKIMHGKTSRIVHDGEGVLEGIKSPFEATRYHSLVVDKDSLPSCLKITALSLDDAEIMGLRHSTYPIEGVQFHPESIITLEGMNLIQNFLKRGVRD
jgi:anthranilate synthase component 2